MSETRRAPTGAAKTRAASEASLPSMDDGERAALREGRHANPHQVLGAHEATVSGVGGIVVRVYQPAAADCAVVVHGVVTPLRPEGDGFFAAFFPGATMPFRYHLRFIDDDGTTWERGDAYRHWPSLGEMDLYLFREGTHRRLWEMLGAHLREMDGDEGVSFAVWAPNAERVSVVGDWCHWDGRQFPMRRFGDSGLWELFIPGIRENALYKFELRTNGGEIRIKTDPLALKTEQAPATASIVVRERTYSWHDETWMRTRSQRDWTHEPMLIYEVHLGSWARIPEQGDRYLTYGELAGRLIPYVKEMGYTHIELLPVMEHPFSGSWGYQVTGFYAPTSRFGSPDEFRRFVDACHQNGIGVILDWVPGHFPKDAHALASFDGTALYEHADPRQGEHRDWGTLIFNYGRNEVRNFLLANALYWLREYHADGLRVDAVASMLYLDYSRREGEWVPNRYGGRENLDAIDFLRQLNTLTHGEHPGSITVAEESTAFPSVSRPTHLGGLGFTYKWNMGWMNDTLEYISKNPVYRRYDHWKLTFSLIYAFTENFILPFSHDEVVHGKGSMFEKIPGDDWQRAATLRSLYGLMYGHPGKKLMFMGAEFAQGAEWNYDNSVDWHLLEFPMHAGMQRFVKDLNRTYAAEAALHEVDFDHTGFQWIDCNDNENSVISFIRRAHDSRDFLVVLLNFTPVPRDGYRIGVPDPGGYAELINSDSEVYGGSNQGNGGVIFTEPIASHGHAQSLYLNLPPLGFLLLKPAR